eukprot:PLAT6401.2.p1 GENE.PLAT6401.2~~PLAT6401.2.p1  ORF type:complete len:1445 (-),score=509.71 PLAT6401.2:40-4374(-)
MAAQPLACRSLTTWVREQNMQSAVRRRLVAHLKRRPGTASATVAGSGGGAASSSSSRIIKAPSASSSASISWGKLRPRPPGSAPAGGRRRHGRPTSRAREHRNRRSPRSGAKSAASSRRPGSPDSTTGRPLAGKGGAARRRPSSAAPVLHRRRSPRSRDDFWGIDRRFWADLRRSAASERAASPGSDAHSSMGTSSLRASLAKELTAVEERAPKVQSWQRPQSAVRRRFEVEKAAVEEEQRRRDGLGCGIMSVSVVEINHVLPTDGLELAETVRAGGRLPKPFAVLELWQAGKRVLRHCKLPGDVFTHYVHRLELDAELRVLIHSDRVPHAEEDESEEHFVGRGSWAVGRSVLLAEAGSEQREDKLALSFPYGHAIVMCSFKPEKRPVSLGEQFKNSVLNAKEFMASVVKRQVDGGDVSEETVRTQLGHLRTLFEREDGSQGELTESEFVEALVHASGLPAETLHLLFRKMDANDDGFLSWDEYLSYLLKEFQSTYEVQKMDGVHWIEDSGKSVTLGPWGAGSALMMPELELCVVGTVKEMDLQVWDSGFSHLRKINLFGNKLDEDDGDTPAVLAEHRLRPSSINFNDISYSAAHQQLVVTFMDRSVRTYELRKGKYFGKLLGTMRTPFIPFAVHVCAPLGKEEVIVIGDDRGLVTAYDMETRALQFKFRPHGKSISRVRFIASLGFVTASLDGRLVITDPDRLEVRHVFDEHRVADFAWCPSRQLMLSVGFDRRVLLWEPAMQLTRVPVLSEEGVLTHSKDIIGCVVNERHNQLITASEDARIKVWDLRTMRCLQNVYEDDQRVLRFLSLDERTGKLVTAGSRMRVWDTVRSQVGRSPPSRPTHSWSERSDEKEAFTAILYTATFHEIVTVQLTGRVSVWDLHQGQAVFEFFAEHSSALTAACLDEGGRMLLTGAHDGTVSMWNFNNGDLLQTFAQRSGEVTSLLHLGKDVPWPLLGTGCDRKLTFWPDPEADEDVAPRELAGHATDVRQLLLCDDRLVTLGDDGDVLLWECESGHLLQRRRLLARGDGTSGAVLNCATYIHEERMVIIGTEGGSLHALSTATLVNVPTFTSALRLPAVGGEEGEAAAAAVGHSADADAGLLPDALPAVTCIASNGKVGRVMAGDSYGRGHVWDIAPSLMARLRSRSSGLHGASASGSASSIGSHDDDAEPAGDGMAIEPSPVLLKSVTIVRGERLRGITWCEKAPGLFIVCTERKIVESIHIFSRDGSKLAVMGQRHWPAILQPHASPPRAAARRRSSGQTSRRRPSLQVEPVFLTEVTIDTSSPRKSPKEEREQSYAEKNPPYQPRTLQPRGLRYDSFISRRHAARFKPEPIKLPEEDAVTKFGYARTAKLASKLDALAKRLESAAAPHPSPESTPVSSAAASPSSSGVSLGRAVRPLRSRRAKMRRTPSAAVSSPTRRMKKTFGTPRSRKDFERGKTARW